MRLGKAKSENFVFSLGFTLGFSYLYTPTFLPLFGKRDGVLFPASESIKTT